MNYVKPAAAIAISATMAATTANAGAMTDPIVEPEIIIEEASSSSSAGILIPLLLLIMIGVALSGGSSNTLAPMPV